MPAQANVKTDLAALIARKDLAALKEYVEPWLPGLALVGIVLWGSLMGSMLPLVLKRLGFDPATSSAPFVATLVDVTGLIIYFSVAFFIMRGTLL